MLSDDLSKSLPPTPGVELEVGLEPHTTFADQRAVLKPTKHHERVEQVPTTSNDPPAIAQGDRRRPKDPDTEDLGWSEDPKVPVPVVQGMNNENLWMLVRRFNKQVFHLRRISEPPPGFLGCRNALTDDSYAPDKLRSALERFYLTIVVGMAATLKHLSRIRSWTETARTAWFCTVYFGAWYKNMLVPAFMSLLLILIIVPSSRKTLFPPAPLAAIDAATGGVKKPAAGHLGSKDSMTGAEEQFRGEAVEREADNFVVGLSSIAVSVAVGKEGEGAGPSSPSDEADVSEGNTDVKVPEVADVAGAVGAQRAASTSANTKISEETEKQAAVPVQQAMWDNIGLVMSAITAVIDVWEMIGNALTSSPPFKTLPIRARLASPVVALLLVSLVLPEFWIYRGITFAIGVGLFGQPFFDIMAQKHFIKYLDRIVPHWRESLDIRNTILFGVPTDNQLTLTLLRLGERNNSPLPPPPSTTSGSLEDTTTPSPPPTAHYDDLPPEYSEQVQQVHAAAASASEPEDGDSEHEQENAANVSSTSGGTRKGKSRLLGFVRGTAKVGVEGVLGVQKTKAVAGSKQAKAKTGIVKPFGDVERAQRDDGPSMFRAKWKGKEGVVTISTTATQPLVAFSKRTRKEKGVLDNPAESVLWSLAIDDVVEVRKVGGFGWKGKMVVGWSTSKAVIDGVEITDVQGKVYFLTALPRRDELFNRLVSIGKQHWESC